MTGRVNKERREYYKKTGLWTELTILDYWNQAVDKWGSREYVADDHGRHLTYKEVDRYADALAAWMLRQRICVGDRVTLQITPRAEFVIAVCACLKAGAVIVPMKMRTGAEEWVRLMEQIEPRIHFCVNTYHGESLVDFVIEEERQMKFPIVNVFIDEARDAGTYFWNIVKEPVKKLPRPETNADDVALILFTSGTTRGSRGVLLSHNNIISSEQIFNNQLHLKEEDSIFMSAPLSHATGFHHAVISPMLYGGRVVLLETYAPDKALAMMKQEQCTYSMGATPFLYDYLKLMDQGVEKPESLKYYICGGAPVSKEIINHAWDTFGLLVCECYGSTESVPHVLVPPEMAVEIGGRYSGVVPEEIEVRVVDAQGNDVEPGEVGEEISRGPNVFLGYLNDPESTALAIDAEGWYYSGDLCYTDGNGWIKICGRKKDIIVRGGENLNINEIEENLIGCPGIDKAAVVGMKDERLGERVCAFVVPKKSEKLPTKESICLYLESKKVSKWLWPERVEYIDALFYTDSGKIRRWLLKQELERRMSLEKEGISA